MEELNKGIILNWYYFWAYKDFSLGFNLCSQSYNELREYYLLLSLGFWQLAIGIRI